VVGPPLPEAPPEVGLRVGAAAVAARVLSSSLSLGAAISGRLTAVTRGGLTPSAALALLYLPGDFFQSGDDLGIRWAALAATVCPGWALRGRVLIEPCGRLTGGVLTATDHSVTNSRSVDRWWGGAGALLRATTSLGWGLHLDLEAGVDVPVVARRFITTTIVPNQPVGATPSVSPALSVGLSHGL
jgi:hypothetical protein